MDETQFQIVRSGGFVLAVGLALTLQRLLPHAGRRGSWRVNAVLWGVNLLVMGAVCGACACTAARWAGAQGIGLFHAAPFPVSAWVAVPVTILGLDLVSYGWHRANHRIPLLWRFHQVHHSDSAFSVGTAARFHPGELVLSLPLRLVAVVLLGASPLGVVIFEIVFSFANFFEHGDINLPASLERRVDRVCITPALHRRHHSVHREELNRNFGTVFALWDRLLGTYLRSSSVDRVEIGLPYAADASNLARALLLPGQGRSALD